MIDISNKRKESQDAETDADASDRKRGKWNQS